MREHIQFALFKNDVCYYTNRTICKYWISKILVLAPKQKSLYIRVYCSTSSSKEFFFFEFVFAARNEFKKKVNKIATLLASRMHMYITAALTLSKKNITNLDFYSFSPRILTCYFVCFCAEPRNLLILQRCVFLSSVSRTEFLVKCSNFNVVPLIFLNI